MAKPIRKVDYFVLRTSNRPGEGAKLLQALRKLKVNLLALSAFPSLKGAQVDLVPEDTTELLAAAEKLEWELSERKTAFLAQGTDRVGVLVRIAETLGAAGINITALAAVAAGKTRFGAIFWVKPADVARAGRLLGAV